MARTTIGLDIGTSGVRAAELSFGADGVVLERFGQVLLPDGAVRDGEVLDAAAVVGALKELWRTTRFSHRRVVVGIANQRVVVRQVELPDMARADLVRALPYQVQDVLPMPVSEALLDFHPLERTTTGAGAAVQRGLLVAAWRDAVEALLAAVEGAGLRAEVVDLSSFAVLRAVGAGLDAEVGTEAIVAVGATTTQVVIHTRGTPHFVRLLLRGGDHLTTALAERAGLSLPEAEALKRQLGLGTDGDATIVGHAVEEAVLGFVDEVRNTIDYHAASSPAHRVERLVLSGGGARVGGLAERLSAATGLPVQPAVLARRVHPGRAVAGSAALEETTNAAVPIGLALGASA